MPRQHVTFIDSTNQIASSYAIIFGDSQKPEIPRAFRGYAGILVSDHRVPASQTTFYAATAKDAVQAALDHLINLPGNKGCRHVIEDGVSFF
jgi:hypothetical protein